jgi:exodeoxyribonuclease V alpha subunit
VTGDPVSVDLFAPRRVLLAPDLLRAFNDAGVLAAADVHVARRLARLGEEPDPSVALAVALAVRAPRLGHVFVDLATIRHTATVDDDDPVDLSSLPWPPVDDWIDRLEHSGLAAAGDDEDIESRPLRLVGSWLYLDRYWREERRLAADLQNFGGQEARETRINVLADGLARLLSKPPGGSTPDTSQRLAAASAVLRRFAVVAGGPGTGKTTTVARIVALLAEQAEAAGSPQPLVAIVAPTGKAAARLEEAVRDETPGLAVSPLVRAHLERLAASTIHRLLGWRPDSQSRFRHHRGNRLPHDVVVVDETSMVSLSLMARLVEAVRPQARLILVGDPGQLTSIEAGAVLGDIVGPAAEGPRMSASARDRLEQATGVEFAAAAPPLGATIGDAIVVLDQVHRFGGAIADVAQAIRRGDGNGVIEALSSAPESVTWIAADPADPEAEGVLAPVRDGVVATASAVIAAARVGDAHAAIEKLGAFRVLCAHRRGPHGVASWMARIEGWLSAGIAGFGAEGRWYVGRPLIVTENDYGLQLYNGDTGVVVATAAGRVSAAFERRGAIVEYSPTRLTAVETVHAMTVHKSQGSQFDTAAVLLPTPASHILTRELLYTAVTRARSHLVLAGSEETVRAAVSRPVARASGLKWRLWGGEPAPF